MRSGCTSGLATPPTPIRSRSWRPGSARMGRCRRTPEPRGIPRGACSRKLGTTSSTISDGERHEGDARGPDHEVQREGRDRSGPARGSWRLDEDGPDRIEGRDEVSFLVEGPARGGAPRRRRDHADITISTDPDTLGALIRREVGPFKAYATGKLRLKGSLEDLARFRKFF